MAISWTLVVVINSVYIVFLIGMLVFLRRQFPFSKIPDYFFSILTIFIGGAEIVYSLLGKFDDLSEKDRGDIKYGLLLFGVIILLAGIGLLLLVLTRGNDYEPMFLSAPNIPSESQLNRMVPPPPYNEGPPGYQNYTEDRNKLTGNDGSPPEYGFTWKRKKITKKTKPKSKAKSKAKIVNYLQANSSANKFSEFVKEI